MSVIQEILKWSAGLPGWQSDVLQRILSQPTLSPQDLDDALALLKAEHGIPDTQGRAPQRLSAAHVSVPAAGTCVSLVAVKDLQHVNAVAEHHRLLFGPTGLTVIFGDNGSGKSGYVRVLKRACRARDQSEAVLPNATLPPEKVGTPAATFEVSVNGVCSDVHWTSAEAAPEVLSSVAIFDCHCARAYLDWEDDFAYVPQGLDALGALADICDHLKTSISSEMTSLVVDRQVFQHLAGETAVGRLVAGLSADTAPLAVNVLASLSVEEEAEASRLCAVLGTGNPAQAANELVLREKRIRKLAAQADARLALVDNDATERLHVLHVEARSARTVATLAAREFRDLGEFLPGTGNLAWKRLFEAARTFSLESHPGCGFPQLGETGRCPLCQQPLGVAAARLVQFDAFIQQDAERNAAALEEQWTEQCDSFVSQNLSIGLDDELRTEIQSIDPALAEDAIRFEEALENRRETIKAAIAADDWSHTGVSPVPPTARLNAVADALTGQAEALRAASDDAGRRDLQERLDELRARQELMKLKSLVLSTIETLARVRTLSACMGALKTNAISLKSTELAEKIVSKELEVALNREFKILGVGSLQVALETRSSLGKASHQLTLRLPQRHKPSQILSEGEQRAIAIASFLAEVEMAGGSSGIVFDDPVCSLDHRRRERVANRLVAEASKRQVVVFTHDVYFLCLLVEEAGRLGVPVVAQTLTRQPDGFGVPDADLPFDGMNTKARVGALRKRQQQIAAVWKAGNEPEYRSEVVDAYRDLRLAWERAVEEILLRRVVLRFRKGVETQRLAEVVVDDLDYRTVEEAMALCSNYAHDMATLGGVAIPEPDELLSDINTLETWRADVEKRSKETADRRKTTPLPSKP